MSFFFGCRISVEITDCDKNTAYLQTFSASLMLICSVKSILLKDFFDRLIQLFLSRSISEHNISSSRLLSFLLQLPNLLISFNKLICCFKVICSNVSYFFLLILFEIRNIIFSLVKITVCFLKEHYSTPILLS